MSNASPRSDLGKATIHGAAWRYLTFFSGKLMILVSTILLARLLLKDDFGLVGYAVTAINFLDIIRDLGIGPAVIYHSEDERTPTTAFWMGLFFSLILLGVAWAGAPFVGVFFHDPRIVPVIRALAFTFPINALGNTHSSVLSKKLAFGRSVLPDLFMALTKGITSIIFAYLGFGAWSLVWGQISGSMISSLTLWIVTPWHPKFFFDFKMARSLMNFGVNIVGVDLLSVLLLNLDYLLVGRYLGSEALGAYILAFRLPDLVILTFARIIGSVIFPVFTHMRDVPGSLGKGFTLVTRYVSLVTVPMGLGLVLVARPLTLTLFTNKWSEMIPALQGIALYGMFLSLAYNAGDAYKADGRPQIITWLSLAQLMLLFPALWWAVMYAKSIAAVGWMQAAVAFVSTMLNLYVATRMLTISISDIINAFRPAIMAGALMSATVAVVLFASTNLPSWQQLALGIISGGVTYGLALWFLQRQVVLDVVFRMRSAISVNSG
jgi:O-antigen/teichoic acid export membrane protein